ncbi:MAG: hypothetical protein JJD97_09285 [Gemmatimonadaceae bacterium]|nr:hypothetical protein [Gemmatimonadaceae bacterium]
MRLPARLRIAASFVALALTAACSSDSTGPSTQSPAQLARHFDSLYVSAAARSDTFSTYGERALLMTFLELPAALGATPATVNVTTASGVEHWKGYELLEVSAPGTTVDSSYILLAYRDADAHTMIIADFDSSGALQEGGVITGDTIAVSPTNGSGTTSLSSVGATCATPSSTLANPQLATLGIGSCNLATFHTNFSMTFSTSSSVDPALANLSFSSATINGVRAVDAASTGAVRRVRAMLRAAAAAKRM